MENLMRLEKVRRHKPDPALQKILIRMEAIKQEVAELADEYTELEAQLLRLAGERESFQYQRGKTGIIATIVRGSHVVYDELSLRKLLGIKWRRVVKESLDTKKLGALVLTDEDITEQAVADCATVIDNKPYVKFTSKQSRTP